MVGKKSPLASAFVSSPGAKRTAGRRCLACSFARRAELERECRAYNRARGDGRTAASWQRFHAVLVEHLHIPIRDWKSLVRHMKTCLGWTVH